MIDVQKFYGFSADPFAPKPDPKIFYTSESHREALAALLYGISYKKGFILLLADAGLGKTAIIRRLTGTLDQRIRIIYFPQAQISFLRMLREILTGLNLHPEHETKGAMLHALYSELIACQGRRETVALVLDGAENIRLDLLEEVRLLANLETGSSKLLQIVLAGRPELGEKLQSDSVRQIQQRIAIHCNLAPLTDEESRRYIEHRLKLAGKASSPIFTDKAMERICKAASGVPAKLNILCGNALTMGYCLSEKKISAATVGKILHKKNVLTEDAARAIAARAVRYRIGMMILIPTLIVLLGLGIFFGKDHILPIFHKPEADSGITPIIVSQPTVAPELEQPAPAAPPIKESASPPAPPGETPAATQPPASPKPQTLSGIAEKPPSPVSPTVPKDIPPQIEVKKIEEVPEGGNLWLLTLKNYKMVNETLMDHILKLNPEITNPHLLKPRQKIKIPELTEPLLLIGYPPDRYKVHLRTFEDLNSAGRYKRIAALWAEDLEIVPLKISPEETWYRVMTGPFAGSDEALKAVEAMTEKGFSIIPAHNELLWKGKK